MGVCVCVHVKKEEHSFTRGAQFEKNKTTVWIKWPTESRATHVLFEAMQNTVTVSIATATDGIVVTNRRC